MQKIKHIFAIILAAFIFFGIEIYVLASDSEAVVSGDDVSLGTEKNITVPVNIDNNPGIMGFKIFAEFPGNVISLESVAQGDVTKTGNFSTKTDSDGKITILWNNTSQVSDNGSLFILNFQVLDSSKNGTISLSFSEEDTFNERYENVPVKLNEIKLIASKYSESVESTPGTDVPDGTAATNKKQNVETVTSVDISSNPTVSIPTNEQESKIDAAVTEIEKNFSDSEIKSIIDNSLKEIDAPSIDKIPPDKIEAFAEDAREQFAIDGVEKISDLNDDELLSALEKVVGTESKAESGKNNDDKTLIVIVSTIAAIVLIVCAVAIVAKNKKIKST